MREEREREGMRGLALAVYSIFVDIFRNVESSTHVKKIDCNEHMMHFVTAGVIQRFLSDADGGEIMVQLLQ
jgi:hypothetical protein